MSTNEPAHPFRSAAVLGAGVMGAQIAAHLANAGLRVELLDLAAKEGPKNAVVESLFARAQKLKPPPFFNNACAANVRLGNFDEHWDRLASVDWVIEVVIEDMAIKRSVLERIESVVSPSAVVSTNTSGLPIHQIASDRGEAFRRRFLGTHFFNPPRYMRLLELVPTPDTDPEVLARVRQFARVHLGKGCVVAKDTPNFIANRIGVYAILQAIRQAEQDGYTFAEVDALTGPLIGHPKSATYRTCDVVGLDTLAYVARNLYDAVPDDESRDAFVVPAVMQALIDAGALGQKTRAGFYKKEGRAILSFDQASGGYRAAAVPDLGDLAAVRRAGDLRARLRALYQDSGRAGAFFKQTTLDLLGYSARRVPEITGSPADLDRAIRWGFGWEIGPFELWDALGFARVREDLLAAGHALPQWVAAMADAERTRFYSVADGQREVWIPAEADAEADPQPADEIGLAAIAKDPELVVWHGEQAALLDLGDGVACYEFRSKANTLTSAVMEGLIDCLERVESGGWRGLVIGNGAEHFSPGANLLEMAEAAQGGSFDQIDAMIRRFQATVQRVHYASVPVVVATSGRVLGGACELLMACTHPVVAAESYVGLVELGAGLIPAGGGTMRMAAWAADRAASSAPHDVAPFLASAFQTVAMARVAGSAFEARELGFIDAAATVVRHTDRRLWVAKQEVLRLAAQGYLRPAKRNAIRVLGADGRAPLELMARHLVQGGHVDDYSGHLASRLAYVMTGGELQTAGDVPEDYLLDLEREVFVALLRETGTQERIAAILGKGKPKA